MSTLPTRQSKMIVENWVRTIYTENPNVSHSNISEIISEYAKRAHIAILNHHSTIFSCTLNINDIEKPFFANPTEIEFPRHFKEKLILDQRPNHPSQFIFNIGTTGRRTSFAIYDIETKEILKEWEGSDYDRYDFLGEDFIVETSRFNNCWQIQHVFDEENEKFVEKDCEFFDGAVADNGFYSVDYRNNKLFLCWPWDEEKESEEIDIPLEDEEDVRKSAVCGNNVFLMVATYSEETTCVVYIYDVIEKDWYEPCPLEDFFEHGYRVAVFDEKVVVVTYGGDDTEAWVIDGLTGNVELLADFDLPSGFEDGFSIWMK